MREPGRQERVLGVWCVMVAVFHNSPARRPSSSTLYTKQTLFIEANPSPCKYAMSLRGECTDAVRLPLVPMGDDNKEIMRAAMEAQGYHA